MQQASHNIQPLQETRPDGVSPLQDVTERQNPLAWIGHRGVHTNNNCGSPYLLVGRGGLKKLRINPSDTVWLI